MIYFSLPTANFVTLKIYDFLGREVQTLVSNPFEAGKYEVAFKAGHLPSGVYFYRLQAGRFEKTRKMLLVR